VDVRGRVRSRAGPRTDLPPLRTAPRGVVELFVWSRLAIWAAALLAWLTLEAAGRAHNSGSDAPWLHDSGWVVDVWGRWDSTWIVRIAEHGYASAANTAAFFPLYPGAVGVLGRIFFGHYVLAGVVVSLAASLGSFLLLHSLAEAKLGAEGARRAVLYLALFPMGLFLQAVYTESLFLFLSLLAFVLAERRRFALAGVAAGLAVLTRAIGFVLLPSLVLFAWRARSRLRALAGLAVAPLLFLVYPIGLRWQIHDSLAFWHAELDPLWARHVSPAGPLGGIWDGLRAGWAGVEQLAAGTNSRSYWTHVHDFTPLHTAAINLEQLAFLVVYVALTIVAWRRFGAPYGLYAALSLAVPLSIPSERWPLLSLPRFGLVVFPFFLALATLGGRPRRHAAVVGISAILLGVSLAQWAVFDWVS
jgi:Mannosyltransferase (PIG-V)